MATSYSTDDVARRYRRGAVVAASVITAVWHTVNDVPATVLSWYGYQWPEVVAASWILYTVIGAACAVALLRNGRGNPNTSLVLAVALLVSGVVVAACRGDATTFANWGWGSVGWIAILALWQRPIRLLTGFLLLNATLNAVVMMVLGTPDRTDVARLIMIVYGSSALQVGFAVGAGALAATVEKAKAAADARSRGVTARLMAEEAHRARQERYQTLQRTAAAVLEGLADGSADPADPAVQRSCSAAAARLRRLFVETDDLPDPLLHELRACVDIAERRGVIVDLVAVGTLPSAPLEVRRALTEPPIEVLAATSSTARVTLIGAPDGITVCIIADTIVDVSTVEHRVGVAMAHHREGDRLWVETQWRLPSP